MFIEDVSPTATVFFFCFLFFVEVGCTFECANIILNICLMLFCIHMNLDILGCERIAQYYRQSEARNVPMLRLSRNSTSLGQSLETVKSRNLLMFLQGCVECVKVCFLPDGSHRPESDSLV